MRILDLGVLSEVAGQDYKEDYHAQAHDMRSVDRLTQICVWFSVALTIFDNVLCSHGLVSHSKV